MSTIKPQIEAWIENGRLQVHLRFKSGWVTTSAGNRLYLTDGGDLQTSPGGPSIYGGSDGGDSGGGVPEPPSPSAGFKDKNDAWVSGWKTKVLSSPAAKGLLNYVSSNEHGAIRRAATFREANPNAKKKDNPYDPRMPSGEIWEAERLASNKLGKKADSITKIIEQGPNYEGRLYRGIQLNPDAIAAVESLGTFEMHAVNSWSKDDSIAKKFSGGDTGWKIIGDFTGKANSADVSFSGNEGEVLSGSDPMRVNSIDKESRTIYLSDR